MSLTTGNFALKDPINILKVWDETGRREALRNEKQVEILLKPNPKRFVLFPIKHEQVWRMYKKAEASFWTTEG